MKWIKDGPIFKLLVNVPSFDPKAIKVFTTRTGDLIVQAGHDERMEEDGHISRRFEARIAVPENVDVESIESSYLDQILTITAKHVISHHEKIIPIFPADPHAHLCDHPRVSPGGP